MAGMCYFVLVIFGLCFFNIKSVYAGEPVVYFPPFELRAVSGDIGTPFMVPVVNNEFQPIEKAPEHRPQRILHTHSNFPPMTPSTPPPQQTEKSFEHQKKDERNSSINVHELLHALGVDDQGHELTDHSRAAARDYDYPSSQYPSYPAYPPAYSRPPSYDYGPRPSYPPPSYGPTYHDSTYAYVPPTAAHHVETTKPVVKPIVDKLDLFKPIATKVAGKVSGLIGLVLTLLTGSSADDLELKGFKDIVINGIVKPLLVAKGGLKTLISKLSIPVISLLLINLEVLITVWWLWEECPQPVHEVHHEYPYSRPTYGYNPY